MTAPAPGLEELEVLRAFKLRMADPDADRNVSPFEERVATGFGGAAGCDLPALHADVRDRVRHTIEAVRAGAKTSQVVLLSGDAGTGKTHLLRTLRDPEAAEAGGYVFVGGSNHWEVREFQARLLDWLVAAVTAPSPEGDHLLLDRVRAIAFRAVDHLLASATQWRPVVARPGRSRLTRLLLGAWGPSYERLKALADARDPAVFGHLDFARFSAYVCDRFLADKANPTHRYALRVLLLYLFPDPVESGVGTRERVLHWLRGRGDDRYFVRRLGAAERLDRPFALFDAVKLLVHLFSPAVSRELAAPARPCPARVFLLVFDQAEGRNELFDGEADWRDFFAHLSELYNTLPNVVVLFTMTLALRHRLHGQMERQFRDRIRMDDQFLLRAPERDLVLDLYRTRVAAWAGPDPDLADRYRRLANPYVPFTHEQVLKVAGAPQSVRDVLAALDGAFHRAMADLPIGPRLDFLYHLRELKPEQAGQTEWDYTAGHLGTAAALAPHAAAVLAPDCRLAEAEEIMVEGIPVLRLRFEGPGDPPSLCVHLARLGKHFNVHSARLTEELLPHKAKARYFLWLVRAKPFDPEVPPNYQGQVVTRAAPPETESAFRALNHVLARRGGDRYEPAVEELIREQMAGTYLGELLADVRARLTAGAPAAEPELTLGAAPAAP